jgi:DNA-directed RNA polymerase sigma subunit (sigma70/sigma32)
MNEIDERENDNDIYLSGNNMTLEEIGKVLGLTKERVRQIEKNTLRKISVVLKRRGITSSRDLL